MQVIDILKLVVLKRIKDRLETRERLGYTRQYMSNHRYNDVNT